MKPAGSASDPLWYKDAIIYELHVRAFADSNNDGIGDLRGIIDRLDYLQDLGVTCLWLLPFFPSPLRDDGYDISNYRDVHPDYGTLDDFRAFLSAAHDRGLQVMIELVINHTSDQHDWFQRAREAAPDSPEREFYVWSDTDSKYPGVRIIFTDTEKSNWTWDPIAKAYYWHRFFSHQPDLNFDNPAVVDEVIATMKFWLDMGVDGLRLDAIPYLIERDGTNCENLPETHSVIKRVRQVMDEDYANRVILAEANQWPKDVRPYFGDGDECHMAFHFPLMPRIFLGLRLEDGQPIRDIIADTPEIPASCQWGLFLRNHDELTLEMVSDDERDYMNLAYSADPRMRINVGIRRRLAPLMDNSRRRIELLYSLLFSFPGTPIVYYGDEIGMGDNIYLGDRNGVRTPMQWNSDRNAGFSRVNPARLYSPLIMDPVYGYAALNVEAQLSDPSSLLHWMRNLIALRKLFHVFGRGSMEFLDTGNAKVLAYLRRHEHEVILCVANLSRFSQPIELNLAAFEGMRPVEMLGYVEFPMIGQEPYALTPGPYGFIWFELQSAIDPIVAEPSGVPVDTGVLSAADGWKGLFCGAQLDRLEADILPRFLTGQRWFAGKSRRIVAARISDWVAIESDAVALTFIDVEYTGGAQDRYFVPMAMAFEPQADVPIAAVLCPLKRRANDEATGVLHDAAFDAGMRTALLACIEHSRSVRTAHGRMAGSKTVAFSAARGPLQAPLQSRTSGGEQSNTSIIYGDRLVLKLFRRLQTGENSELEIGRYLTEQVHFTKIAAVTGTINYTPDDGEPANLALLQAFLPNQGDGWTWTIQELARYYEACRQMPPAATAEHTAHLDEQLAPYLAAVAVLGRVSAELSLALATPTSDSAFAPEPWTQDDLERAAIEMQAHSVAVFENLKRSLPDLPDSVLESAGLVLGRRAQFMAAFSAIAKRSMGGQRTRVHGDYHLGQVLRIGDDFAILDFEGEPARTPAERRAKHSPLKDVAGMLRSFSYAAWLGLAQSTQGVPEMLPVLEPWAHYWEKAASGAFLRAYRETAAHGAIVPADPVDFEALLQAYVLDKAIYEIAYELNNRPGWVGIPLRGVLAYRGAHVA